MGLGVTRAVDTCFCADACPSGTRPFKQYWIAATAPTPPNYGIHVYLYEFLQANGLVCEWRAKTPHFPVPRVELLTKSVNDLGPPTMTYTFVLALLEGITTNTWSNSWDTTIPETGSLVVSEAQNSCQRSAKFLFHTILGPTWFALMTPAFPDACDDADFPAKEQRKIVAPY